MPTAQEVSQIFPIMAQRLIPEKAQGVNASIQFNLSGDNGGLYWLKIADGKAEAGEGAVDNPKMTLKASADDYFAVANGTLNPTQAVFTGKLKIEGDMSLAMKMTTMFATG
jgi:putative sterol carrier protein